MRHHKPEYITITSCGIFYRDRAISLNDLKYVYMSGANSHTEYSDNLGCYSISLRNSHDSYVLLETQDKSEARRMMKDIYKVFSGHRGIKMYNNCAIVNLNHLEKVELSNPQKESGNKVKLYMDNGRILRVYKSAFAAPAKIYAATINADLKNYSRPTM